jgi:hypothetical protein
MKRLYFLLSVFSSVMHRNNTQYPEIHKTGVYWEVPFCNELDNIIIRFYLRFEILEIHKTIPPCMSIAIHSSIKV